jgi:hypothetical protein
MKIILLSLLVFSVIVPVASADVINITIDGKAWTPGYDRFYDATIKLNGTRTLRISGVYDVSFNVTISVPSWGKTWNFVMNGTQIEYNIHFGAGEDVGYIPPHMIADLTNPAREMSVLEKYNIYLPVRGVSFTGWNINDYWTFSGILVEAESGDIFQSWNPYFFFFRYSGNFGTAPAGTTYKDLVKKVIYYRTKIIEDIWKSMENLGIYDSYWNNLGSYLNNQVKIWKGVRSIIGYYIP